MVPSASADNLLPSLLRVLRRCFRVEEENSCKAAVHVRKTDYFWTTLEFQKPGAIKLKIP